jgi:hypothetical protein
MPEIRRPERQIVDKLSRRLSKFYRKVFDMKMKIIGSRAKMLILQVDEVNSLGDKDTTVTASKEIPAFIKYPAEVTIFRKRDENGNLIQDNMIFLEDVLPFEMSVGMEDAITVEESDIIVDVLEDERGFLAPQLFKISRALGNYMVKHLLVKRFILAPLRDNVNENIMDAINDYLKETYGENLCQETE